MDITSIGKTAPNSAIAPKSAGLNMDAETFMKLFTTQLANQNPTDPMDSADFLNQFSQITSIQTLTDLQKTMGDLKTNLGNLTQTTNALQAQSMLGRNVEFTDALGATRTAQVEAIRISNGASQLVVTGGTIVNLDSVRQIMSGTN